MRAIWITTLSLVLATGCALLVAEPSPEDTGQGPAKQVFTGQYQWTDGGNDDLTAEFSATGDDTWNVKFRFKFQGKDNTWSGAMQGSLSDGGRLTGSAESSDGRRTWDIAASIAGDELRGNHTETTGGRRYETGTFVLTR